MTQKFLKRVEHDGIVDTRNYRYISRTCGNATFQWTEIRRIPLNLLGTFAAYSGWETVAKLHNDNP